MDNELRALEKRVFQLETIVQRAQRRRRNQIIAGASLIGTLAIVGYWRIKQMTKRAVGAAVDI